MDPRRLGRNNSGLSEADISDVMCILHPCSPAAFKIVATTAERSPFNVLQNNGYGDYDDGLTQSALEEQETFILNRDDGNNGSNQAMDLALRFSANLINPTLGFVFGRNARIADIVLATDSYKRVSNMHFSIFINQSGVLMLRDMSTNGTMVDDMVLKGKNTKEPQTRMLSPGSIIQILSPKPEEIVKFIVRIPSREGHVAEYEEKWRWYMRRVAAAEAEIELGDETAKRLAAPNPNTANAGGSYKAPLVQNQHGIHWTGGDKYNVVGLIGKGAFATVYQLATKAEGHLVAAKELEKRRFMKNGVLDRKLDNELQIMKEISHPNIVQYIDYHDHANHLYIIMEFVPCGDLQQYLGLHGPLSEDLGKKMAAQVLDSLAYLHTKKITHRDIKPDNILLADLSPDNFTIKLSDFGLSKVVKDNDTFLKTFCGTLLYCAPEVFPHYDAHVAGRGQKRPRHTSAASPASKKFHSYSQSVDVWSFGAVLWFSLCNRPPFEGVADNTGRGMFEKIMLTPLDSTDLIAKGVSDEAVGLLAEMLNTDPAARPSPGACLRHEWFTGQAGQAGEAAIVKSPELGLKKIVEEDEDGEGEPDMSQLSLQEQQRKGFEVPEESQDSHYIDEASIGSGSMNFFDPRQSKRFKSEAFAFRDQQAGWESSPELLNQPVHIRPATSNGTSQGANSNGSGGQQQRRLFGEISASALNAAGGLGVPVPETQGAQDKSALGGSSFGGMSQVSNLSLQQAERLAGFSGLMASPSLLGAESLLRDVHMESPGAELDEPTTPHTPDEEPRPFSAGQQADEITPKQPQHRAFNRQIEIPLPPSFFFDPNDESTHTLEYASRVSGFDYESHPQYGISKVTTSLPATASREGSSGAPPVQGTSERPSSPAEEQQDEAELDSGVPDLQPAKTDGDEFVKPPPRLGRLITTPTSSPQITLNLSQRTTMWGRAKENTIVYADKYDTRVAKRSLIVWFHAKGMDKLPENADWTKLPGLHCGIATESTMGVHVNGVHLKKSAPIGTGGELFWGRVYTGDEIEVCPPSGGRPGLRFRCEFFHGEGKETRAEGTPAFKVVHEKSRDGSSQKSAESARQREREHVVVASKVAAI